MIDPDDIADGYKKPEKGEEETSGCTCSAFEVAVQNGFIRSPGDRIPHTRSFSKKYFITRYDEVREMHYFIYIDYCPNCGRRIT